MPDEPTPLPPPQIETDRLVLSPFTVEEVSTAVRLVQAFGLEPTELLTPAPGLMDGTKTR